MRKLSYIILAVMLMSMCLVSAAPPFESEAGAGLTFAPSSFDEFKVNTDYTMHLHVINGTETQTNVTTSCFVHLYNSVGDHILEEDMEWDSNGMEFKLDVAGGNQTLGKHAAIMQCNNTGKEIHLVKFGYIVTPTGMAITPSQTYIYILGFAALVLLQIFLFILTTFLPSMDSKDEQGAIIQVSQLKHLRTFLWTVIWGLVVAELFIVSNISLAYLDNTMMGALFFALFQVMFWVSIIILPIYWIVILMRVFKDKEFQTMIDRGGGLRRL